MKIVPEFMDEDGAKRLADRLRSYWADRGFDLTTHVVPLAIDERHTIWIVRSDMVNGVPPYRLKAAA